MPHKRRVQLKFGEEAMKIKNALNFLLAIQWHCSLPPSMVHLRKHPVVHAVRQKARQSERGTGK